MHNRPLSFAEENQKGMRMFLEAIFQAGRSVTVGEVISPGSYIPSRTPVKSALENVSSNTCVILRQD